MEDKRGHGHGPGHGHGHHKHPRFGGHFFKGPLKCQKCGEEIPKPEKPKEPPKEGERPKFEPPVCPKCGEKWAPPKPKCPFCKAELPRPQFKPKDKKE